LSKDIATGETNRKEALDKAAVTVQTALDKAERALQASLGEAKKDLERSLNEAEKRVDERFRLGKTAADEMQATTDSLYNEKFGSIQKQFEERDVRSDQSALASSKAIDAGLLTQKAAADKSEMTIKEQILGLQALFQSSIDPMRVAITALTGRVDRGEGTTRGVTDSGVERRGNVSMVVGIASMASVVISTLPLPLPLPLTMAIARRRSCRRRLFRCSRSEPNA
jgi:hypothetical protein